MEAVFTDDHRYFSDPLLKHIQDGNNQEVLRALNKVNPCQLVDRSNTNLLHIGAKYGNSWLVSYLIELGANVDAPNDSRKTPLMLAVKNLKIEAITVLLDANADMFVPDAHGRCALAIAFNMTFDNNAIANLLLERVTSDSLNSSVHVEDPEFHVHCPLYHFMSMKNVEVIKILLAKGSPVNVMAPFTGNTAFHVAVQQLDVEIAKLLLAHGADVHATNYSFDSTPLHSLADYRDQDKVFEMIDILLAAGAKLIDHDQRIIRAERLLMMGDKQVIRRVLEHRLDLNFRDRRGFTSLHYLAQNRNPDVLDELRDIDFDVRATADVFKFSMLHYAASSGNPSSIRFLLDRGADIDVTADYYGPPLSHIFDRDCTVDDRLDSYVECVEILLARGADPRVWPVLSGPSAYIPLKLMSPIVLHLSVIEASGREMCPVRMYIIQSNSRYKDAFCSKKAELEEMKKIKLGKSVTVLDILAANDKEISLYARNRSCAVGLFNEVKKDNWDPCYQRKLHESFLRLTKLVDLREKAATVIYDIFNEFYNTSVYNVAQKIIDYLNDHELPKFL